MIFFGAGLGELWHLRNRIPFKESLSSLTLRRGLESREHFLVFSNSSAGQEPLRCSCPRCRESLLQQSQHLRFRSAARNWGRRGGRLAGGWYVSDWSSGRTESNDEIVAGVTRSGIIPENSAESVTSFLSGVRRPDLARFMRASVWRTGLFQLQEFFQFRGCAPRLYRRKRGSGGPCTRGGDSHGPRPREDMVPDE